MTCIHLHAYKCSLYLIFLVLCPVSFYINTAQAETLQLYTPLISKVFPSVKKIKYNELFFYNSALGKIILF